MSNRVEYRSQPPWGGPEATRNPPNQGPSRPENPTSQLSPEIDIKLILVYTLVFGTWFSGRPEIVDVSGLGGPPKTVQKSGGLRPLPFWKGLEADRARLDPKYKRFRLRPKPWLQMARTLVSVAVAFNRFVPRCNLG